MSDSGRVDDHQQAKSAKQPVKWKHEQCWKSPRNLNPLPAEIIWNEPTLRFAEVPASKNSCTSLCNYCDFMHFYQLFLRWLVSAFVSEIYQITCNLLCIFQTWKYFFLCGAVALWYTCACRSPVSIPVHCWEDSRLRSDCNSIEFAH